MRVFVTGGTGFVGREVTHRLLAHGHSVTLLIHKRPSALPEEKEVSFAYGSILDKPSLLHALEGRGALEAPEAVIHLVGIIREAGEGTFEKIHFEGAKNVIDAARGRGLKRFVLMSAEGTRQDAPSRYHRTKYKAERYLQDSGLAYTIFRPAVIFGPGDQSLNTFAGMIRLLPAVPVIGDGNYKWRPVSVNDVAELFARAVENEKARYRAYDVAGPDEYTFNRILEIMMRVMGKEKPTLHLPLWLVKPPVLFLNKFFSSLPVTGEQLIMLLDTYERNPDPGLDADFPGMRFTPFEEGLREYLK